MEASKCTGSSEIVLDLPDLEASSLSKKLHDQSRANQGYISELHLKDGNSLAQKSFETDATRAGLSFADNKYISNLYASLPTYSVGHELRVWVGGVWARTTLQYCEFGLQYVT